MGYNTDDKNIDASPPFIPSEEKDNGNLFWDRIMEYMEQRTDVPGVKQILRGIETGKQVSVFPCREDVSLELSWELLDKKIPYFPLSSTDGTIRFLVLNENGKEVDTAIKKVLEKKGKFLPLLSGAEVLAKEAADEKHKDGCISITGLTVTQAITFAGKMEREMQLPYLGIDKMSDNTYSITMNGLDTISIDPYNEEADACQLLLETTIETGGPLKDYTETLVKSSQQLQEALADDFLQLLDKVPGQKIWIVGWTRQYVTITEDEFVYGRTIVQDGHVEYKELRKAGRLDPDFHRLLVSYCSRIPAPHMTTDATEVWMHFSGLEDDGWIDELNTFPSDAVREAKAEAKFIAETIHKAVARKLLKDNVAQDVRLLSKAVRQYMREAGAAIEAMVQGEIPPIFNGEPKEVIERLRAILRKRKNEKERAYQNVISLCMLDVMEMRQSIEQVHDLAQIGKEIQEEHKKERDMRDKPTKDRGRRSRSTRTREQPRTMDRGRDDV